MEEENAVPEIVQEIINSKGQIKAHAEVLDEEILAYLRAMNTDVVAEAIKIIVLAKQGNMIEALAAEVNGLTEASLQKKTEESDGINRNSDE